MFGLAVREGRLKRTLLQRLKFEGEQRLESIGDLAESETFVQGNMGTSR